MYSKNLLISVMDMIALISGLVLPKFESISEDMRETVALYSESATNGFTVILRSGVSVLLKVHRFLTKFRSSEEKRPLERSSLRYS